jgi:hypothetical protein
MSLYEYSSIQQGTPFTQNKCQLYFHPCTRERRKDQHKETYMKLNKEWNPNYTKDSVAFTSLFEQLTQKDKSNGRNCRAHECTSAECLLCHLLIPTQISATHITFANSKRSRFFEWAAQIPRLVSPIGRNHHPLLWRRKHATLVINVLFLGYFNSIDDMSVDILTGLHL